MINKYLYYCLCSRKDNILALKHEGAIPSLNVAELSTIKIPLPDIERQKEIAEILDRFNRLINDLSDGLPAEIAARKKQYEYYRDTLLTFKEKKSS